jgi:hypothetical protein
MADSTAKPDRRKPTTKIKAYAAEALAALDNGDVDRTRTLLDSIIVVAIASYGTSETVDPSLQKARRRKR